MYERPVDPDQPTGDRIVELGRHPAPQQPSRSAGARVIATTAAETMTSVLVIASGRRSRPVSSVNANTGRKLSAVINREVRIAVAIVPAAAMIAARRSPAEAFLPRLSILRWQASSATTSA